MFATLVPWMQLTGSHRLVVPALVELTSLWQPNDCSKRSELSGRDNVPPPSDGMEALPLRSDAAAILSHADDLGASAAPACVALAKFALRLIDVVKSDQQRDALADARPPLVPGASEATADRFFSSRKWGA